VKVPFVNLLAQHEELREPIERALRAVMEQSAFSGGVFVEQFEDRFARAVGRRHCLAVNSGTAALHLALAALGIGAGDEVLVPSCTFFATPEAVSLCGARPVFLECDEYFHLDVDAAEKSVTPRTRAIIPVHLYGQAVEMGAIVALAGRYGIPIVEDCAQSHFARYQEKITGTFGAVGCFSFYPSKNLGTCGEGGAVVTDDAELYARMNSLRSHGSTDKYTHSTVGFNYRMGGFEAALLDVKLDRIEAWNAARRTAASSYLRRLHEVPGIGLPRLRCHADHVWHLFPILVERREALRDHLSRHGVQTGIHYPVPCHLQPAYSGLGYSPGSLPRTEFWADHILSLPIHSHISEEEIAFVCKNIEEFCAAT
jgi:dTDP-4-amino-4,6-dideoxygalactose transaminase